MSMRAGNVIVIEDQPDGVCELCRKTGDVRPYGPGGTNICYDCGLAMPKLIEHNMGILLFGMPGELWTVEDEGAMRANKLKGAN